MTNSAGIALKSLSRPCQCIPSNPLLFLLDKSFEISNPYPIMISKLFQITLFFFATIFLVSAQQDSYIDMFVPDFGIVPGTNKQNGTCEGFEGIRIDCECPPSKGDFTKVSTDLELSCSTSH